MRSGLGDLTDDMIDNRFRAISVPYFLTTDMIDDITGDITNSMTNDW